MSSDAWSGFLGVVGFFLEGDGGCLVVDLKAIRGWFGVWMGYTFHIFTQPLEDICNRDTKTDGNEMCKHWKKL